MSRRDRRQLKVRIDQHRPQPEAPSIRIEVPDDTSMPRLEGAGLLFAGPTDHSRSEARPLTVEFVAMRLQEALIRKEGRSALDPVVALDCVSSARLLLAESHRG